MVRLCEGLGAKVAAEGIETIDELNAVIAYAVHYGQGYLIAHRVPYSRPAWPFDVGSRIWRAG